MTLSWCTRDRQRCNFASQPAARWRAADGNCVPRAVNNKGSGNGDSSPKRAASYVAPRATTARRWDKRGCEDVWRIDFAAGLNASGGVREWSALRPAFEKAAKQRILR